MPEGEAGAAGFPDWVALLPILGLLDTLKDGWLAASLLMKVRTQATSRSNQPKSPYSSLRSLSIHLSAATSDACIGLNPGCDFCVSEAELWQSTGSIYVVIHPAHTAAWEAV